MFNSQSKETDEQESEENIIASICYYVTNKDNSIMIDISLEDFENTSIDKLCEILKGLSEDKSYFETLEIVKNNLSKTQNEDALLRFLTNISIQSVGKKIMSNVEKKISEQPCIRPSDLLK